MWPRALLTVALRGPGKGLLVASAAGWIVMAALAAGNRLSHFAMSPGHGAHAVATSASSILERPANFMAVWLAMILAMSPPLLLREIGRLWRTSLRRLRHLTIGWFVCGYVGVWSVAGVGLAIIFGWLTVSSGRIGVAVALIAIWYCSPARQRCLNACHRPATFRVSGTAAQGDALRYGISTGGYCAAACGPAMVLVVLATDYHLVVMAFAVAVSVVERYLPARRPVWRLPLLRDQSVEWPNYSFVDTHSFRRAR
jgi:predicted metal-binding membrane protein